ncbi:HGL032Cp [Eremothecium sinecaudum]|uniref:HGL032Cp n=1 Tax=Eremothecium sinecaudum TaxID=45286 RepID=A0A120K2Q7_9SACH|nr:HGL032Cp [Eremothecium sinecaudum]AMD22308.1 HGL032Cp [Eremothecium sinecaudum]
MKTANVITAFAASSAFSANSANAFIANGAGAPMVDDNPKQACYVAEFPQGGSDKIAGYITFTSYEGIAKVSVELASIINPEDGFSYHIHEKGLDSNDECACYTTGEELNPYNGIATCNDVQDKSLCKVGDLSGKYGAINSNLYQAKYLDPYLGLYASSPSYIGERSIAIHKSDGTRIACADIIPCSERKATIPDCSAPKYESPKEAPCPEEDTPVTEKPKPTTTPCPEPEGTESPSVPEAPAVTEGPEEIPEEAPEEQEGPEESPEEPQGPGTPFAPEPEVPESETPESPEAPSAPESEPEADVPEPVPSILPASTSPPEPVELPQETPEPSIAPVVAPPYLEGPEDEFPQPVVAPEPTPAPGVPAIPDFLPEPPAAPAPAPTVPATDAIVSEAPESTVTFAPEFSEINEATSMEESDGPLVTGRPISISSGSYNSTAGISATASGRKTVEVSQSVNGGAYVANGLTIGGILIFILSLMA